MKKKAFPFSAFTVALTIVMLLASCWDTVLEEDPIVYIGNQVGTLTEYTSGTATFLVTTMNIDNSEPGTVQCYLDSVGTEPANPPAGIEASVSTGSADRTLTFTIGQDSQTRAGTYYFRVTINGTESNVGKLVIDAKTVSVGEQSDTITAGTAGTVTFPVTTANIADGSYTVTVANLPTGVAVSGQVTISNNSGTLTLAGNTSTIAGTTSTLTLTIDNATSAAFTLTIVPPLVKTVTVGAQVGTMTAGTAGTVTFPVTTTNIANGTYSATVANLPTGVIVQGQGQLIINNNSGTLTLAGNTSTIAGTTTTLRLTIDSTQSETFNLRIETAPVVKTVSVGSQAGNLYAGTAGTVTFPVTTTNIANGVYSATVANLPTGVTVSGQVTINNNNGTLTLAGNASTVAATTENLRLTIDNTQSGTFNLRIEPALVKTVSVSMTSDHLYAGIPGSVAFPVSTTNIADGTYTATVTNRPTGVTVSGQVVIYKDSGTLTLAGNTSTVAGTYSTLTLTIDNTTSSQFTLTIVPPLVKTVSVGQQVGTIIEYTNSTATFVVSTDNIVNTATGTVQWYSNAGGSTPASAPSGITTSVSTGSANRTLTFAFVGADQAGAGTYYFRVTIDGVESNVGTLVIVAKTVTVGTQQGTIMGHTVGAVTFAINTSYIANSAAGTVQWYSNAGGSTSASAPSGITTSISTGSANRILTVNSVAGMGAAPGTPPGTYYFRVYIEGVESNVGSLVISN